MKPIKDHIWVEYPKTYKDEARHGSLVIWKDTSYKPEWNVIQYGKVVQPSIGSSMFENRGIIDETQPGDKIYFNYSIPEAGDEFYEEGGVRYMRVPLWAVYCTVRERRIIPIGSYVLTKAIYEEHEEVEVGGKLIRARVANGLVTGIDVTHDKRFTKVSHIGMPLEGIDELRVEPGDTVMMESNCDNELEIEGEKYFVMKQENILCTISKQ
jgi:co-chaperonin GroES (HSP10)